MSIKKTKSIFWVDSSYTNYFYNKYKISSLRENFNLWNLKKTKTDKQFEMIYQ